jgi:hypothetical protein
MFLHLLGQCPHLRDLFFSDFISLLRDTVTLLVEAVDLYLIENEIPQVILIVQHFL